MSKHKIHPLTDKINQKQKMLSKQSRSIAQRWLAETFPRAFDDTSSIHPLKQGIMNDILSHSEAAKKAGISKTKLREAVIVFTRRIDYLICLKVREMRIDLDGNPTVQVTEEEALQATTKIRKQIEKRTKLARQTMDPAVIETKSKPALQPNQGSATYPNDAYYEPRYATAETVARKPPLIVTKKTSKSYDPNAVARLKEKLGLSS